MGISAVWGLQSFDKLQASGYNDPNSESTLVYDQLSEEFNVDNPELTIIAEFGTSVDDADSVTAATELTSSIEDIAGVESVSSYYSLGSPESLKSTDGTAAYFFINYDTDVTASAETTLIMDTLGDERDGVQLHYTGLSVMANALNGTIGHDIATAESIAIPLSIILLLFVFGSVIAAGLPLVIGGLSMLGSFFFIWVATQFTDVSIFAVNLISAMALGLGIDYSLLIINRFREERAKGVEIRDAVLATMETAGRTVLFSGLTVAVVLASLVIFPMYFLRSMGFAGVAVVIVAVLGALVALPAMLMLLGDRVNKWRIFKRDLVPTDTGVWSSVSRFVMKRAIPVFLITIVALGGLVALGNNVSFGLVDERVLPADSPTAISAEIQRTRFDGQEAMPLQIIATGATDEQLADYVEELSNTAHIVRVQSALGVTVEGETNPQAAGMFTDYVIADHQRIVAVADVVARSQEGMDVVTEVRALDPPFEVKVGGVAADYADSMNGITEKVPLLLLWVFIATFILLFLFTGSVLLPIKAFLLNIVSLVATLGFLTWVFMDGNLQWLIGSFTPLENIESSMFILIAVVTFGLSMDYELFLLSRIKELHDEGMNTEDSVSLGLQRSGRIITAAALVLAANFLPMLTSGVTTVKMLGLGLAFAILLDATVVRGLLVPATMKLFGKANWWAPKWMRWISDKAGMSH
ncbi:RND superfamily putative drug exporter [Aurantimicrobium minutum]|uniref:MMPL family transporter n=1 Tax=Aurantimicrobium minutum TaxID=708131 RepID=UPI002475E464|nr:MMPL family transporter [Aurantimicrobium minutum]MDH6532722.1 RND superfamily putative drug exporter [Aurantimicrobium minutum]